MKIVMVLTVIVVKLLSVDLLLLRFEAADMISITRILSLGIPRNATKLLTMFSPKNSSSVKDSWENAKFTWENKIK